jgi:hypothetical protein
MTQQDRIGRALRRVHSAALVNTTIEVSEPTETYTPGGGFGVSYSNKPDATFDVRLSSPSASTDRDRGGTTGEIDATISIRDDTGQQFVDYTDELEAPVEIVDTADGTRYEVESRTDPHNGLIELDVVEVS